MHLAEDITVTIEDERFDLRPSLRAAMRLERRHGGFTAITNAVFERNANVMADIIGECSGTSSNVLALLLAPGLAWRLTDLLPALLVVVNGLMGFDPDAEEKPNDKADQSKTTFAEAYAELFRVGTGCLGWSPAETWAATPLEIRAASKGHFDYLKAINGVEDDEDQGKGATVDQKTERLMMTLAALPGATIAAS